jgi:hypothetical protein
MQVRQIAIELLSTREAVENVIDEPSLIDDAINEARQIAARGGQ